MLRFLYPDAYMESVLCIDFKHYRDIGYKGIIFDIDNTLVCHGAPATEEIITFISNLRELGYEIMVMSNNKEPRVKSFADAVGGIGYIYKANKPAKASYLRCMDKMQTNVNTTLFVGDQLFTDIWGAKRCGIFSILVKPIDKKEEIQIVIKRYFEKIVLHFYLKEKKKRGN